MSEPARAYEHRPRFQRLFPRNKPTLVVEGEEEPRGPPGFQEVVYRACSFCGFRTERNRAGEFAHPVGVSGRPRCQEPPELWR